MPRRNAGRASGPSATASRSTRTSGASGTTTGCNVRQRIIDIYQHTGFAGIDPADLRGRFRWYGLYTQRAPGIPGGRTAILEPEELEDEYFMLRVRIDGGALTSRAAAGDRRASRPTYGRDVADITDRQNIQLHWIRIEDVPEIWEQLEAVGLYTTEACGDTPRVMLGCPLEGVAADAVLDARPGAARGPSSATSATRRSPTCRASSRPRSPAARSTARNHEINDVAFVGVLDPDGDARLRPLGRRRAVHQPDVRPAAGRVRPAGRGRRGVGRRHAAVPRLRLPALAQPRPAEVPDRRLGAEKFREVLREGVPRPRAAGRPGAAGLADATATTSV